MGEGADRGFRKPYQDGMFYVRCIYEVLRGFGDIQFHWGSIYCSIAFGDMQFP